MGGGEYMHNEVTGFPITIEFCFLQLRLRGLSKQSEIGLLSLFEHYQSCRVGEGILCIFIIRCYCYAGNAIMAQPIILPYQCRLQKRFDLHYFDGLATQDEVIRLTIGTLRDVQTTANVIVPLTDNAEGRELLVEDGLTPPLELCIQTK